ncbi:P-loop containing nucleoside triphosphate hydrolase, partial [Colletotrichum plurivorum]
TGDLRSLIAKKGFWVAAGKPDVVVAIFLLHLHSPSPLTDTLLVASDIAIAEAIAGFALAGNVLQFIEFGGKWAHKSIQIHRSTADAPDDLRDLRNAAKRIQDASQQLKVPERDRVALSAGHQQIVQVADSCLAESAKIMASLDKIGGSGLGNRKRGAAAAKQALKLLWKQEELEDLESKIQRLGQELNLALLQLLRDLAMSTVEQQTVVLQEIRLLQASSGRIEKRLTDARTQQNIDGEPGERVLEFIVGQLNADPKDRPTRVNSLRGDILRGMRRPQRDQDGVSTMHDAPAAIHLPRTREVDLQRRFLANLRYRGMDSREARITKAHKETFQWIFEAPPDGERTWANFKEWLESDSSLYWITGKAGSGKSTLMKFICHGSDDYKGTGSRFYTLSPETTPNQCHDLLRKWSGDRPLIAPSFYFCASGTAMEASRRGLYMSLLYRIVQVVPGILPQIAPREWEQIYFFDEDMAEIPEDDLQSIMLRAIVQAQATHSICLFVDGLDEFSGPQSELVDLVREISSFPNVKTCVSSRPWIVFQDAFEAEPSLKLEHFTYNDIKMYVTDSFERETGFSRLLRREPEYGSRLVDTIITKSNGVFFWVTLVVRDLLSVMQNDDRIADFEKRLDLLPADLGDLFDTVDTILNSWNPEYFKHAAQYFALAGAYRDVAATKEGDRPPPALLFSFADEADAKIAVRKAIELEAGALSREETELRLETVRRRVNSRCKGLLEVAPDFIQPTNSAYVYGDPPEVSASESVQYLHRSVKDYIQGPGVHQRILAATKAFDSHIRLCSASLAFLKTETLPTLAKPVSTTAASSSYTKHSVKTNSQTKFLLENFDQRMAVSLLIGLDLCMLNASTVREENVSHVVALLDNLHETVRSAFVDANDIYPRLYNLAVSRTRDKRDRLGSTFFSFAVSRMVLEYVKAKAPPRALVRRTETDIVGRLKTSKLPILSRLKILGANLLDGVEASSTRADTTVWWPLLQDAAIRRPPPLAVVNCLLSLGADVNFPLSKNETVWTQLLADMVYYFVEFALDLESIWQAWLPVLRLYIDHDADVKAGIFRVAVNSSGCCFRTEQLRRTIRCIKNGDDDAARSLFMAEVQSRKPSMQ